VIDPRLNHVVAVAREGSFTAAARSVGVTQSAITKSIADLETRLGHLIFHRTSRGALLTEEGREFVERASRLLEDATDLLQSARKKDDPYAGVLSIGICPASMEWCLIEPLSRLLSQHPSIRLDVSGSTFERVVQQLRNGRVDVAVGFAAAFHEWPDLTSTPISYLRSTFFVRKGHPLLAKARVTQEDMAAYEFVSPSDSQPYGAVIRDIFESQGIEWRKRLHVIDFFPIVRSVVAKTDAIGVVDRGYAKSNQFKREFETIDTFDPMPRDPLCCAMRVRWEPKPAVRAFVAAMKACLPLEGSNGAPA
jgi:DNA-binding transcriptional LysR family regulator